jgi:4-hydroxy-4-methyl-2-oxoglutarate aldolase
MPSMIRPDELSQRAAALTTSGLSDAMDRLGIPGQVAGVRAIGTARSLCGPAYTVRYRPVQAIGETVGDFIDDVPAGAVVVIDNQGRSDCTVWGDILTETAYLRELAGTVIDGTCRDAQACDDVGYPLFARANWMRTGKDRVAVDAVGGPVDIGDVRVTPGDLVVGDRDGVVILPAGRAAEIVGLAEEIEAAEQRIRLAVRSGERLDAARAKTGYHELQRQANAGSSETSDQEQK